MMVRRSVSLIGAVVLPAVVLVCVMVASATAAEEHVSTGRNSAATVRVHLANSSQIDFSLETPLVTIPKDGHLDVPGLSKRVSAPGLPALPYYSTYIVVPPESMPRLIVDQTEPVVESNVTLPLTPVELVETAPMLGADTLALELQQKGNSILNTVGVADAGSPPFDSGPRPTSSSGSYYPRNIVELSQPMMFRDVRLVRVTIYPIQYDASQRLLKFVPDIKVTVDFGHVASAEPIHLAPSHGNQHLYSIAPLVLNPDQLASFRGLPRSLSGQETEPTGTKLPLGVELYKISVIDNGIHELNYDALKSAGMNVDTVNPSTLEMMYRGQAVASQFVGDSDAVFEPGESLRFYGHVFDGSRLERQYINENIFWLWDGGQSTPMESRASLAGQPVTTYVASLTTEPENVYFQGFTAYWPENEPDAWYWDWWTMSRTPVTRTFTVTLPSPKQHGMPAQFTAEFSSRDSHISDQAHELAVTMNGSPAIAGRSWWGESNFNVSASIPLTSVLDGPNQFYVKARTDGAWAHLALNRITVDYQRPLRAIDDQLIFEDQATGLRQYHVQGISQPDRRNLMAWDITDPYSPTAIVTSSLEISGDGPYTVTYGVENSGDGTFIVTTADNVLSPASIDQYVAQDLDPPAGAEWVAITYKDFVTETRRLAAHRSQATFGGLTTHIADVEEIVNQFGYGLPIPLAIRSYLAHAMASWPVKPSYVAFIGDTTLDPRRIKDDWTDNQYVLTDLLFVDRYNGHIPSDFTFALVSGSDMLPDLSVGRIAVEDVGQLASTIDKIILYDETQLLSFGWMANMLHVADKYDSTAGDFCYQQQLLSSRLPGSMNKLFLCLDDYSDLGQLGGEALRNDMFGMLEDSGATMLTYRGHGAVEYWGGNPVILSVTHLDDLTNQKPFVAISGDCLDGHYAYPPKEGLGETLVNFPAPAANTYGAAAHWGSSGLGISTDHTDILNGFYDGLFMAGATALGDAANYAKLVYFADPWNDPALMYSFNLQGDPAMHLMRPNVELQGEWQYPLARPGEQATISVKVMNHGVYPSQVTLVGKSISDFALATVSSTVPHSLTMVGDSIKIALQFGDEPYNFGIPRNGRVTVSITYDIAPAAALGPRTANFAVEAYGQEAWPGNEVIAKEVFVLRDSLWLPMQRK